MTLSLNTLKAEMRKFMVESDENFVAFPTSEAEAKAAWMSAYKVYCNEGATVPLGVSPSGLSSAASAGESSLFSGSTIEIGGSPILFSLESAIAAFWAYASINFVAVFPPPTGHETVSVLYTGAETLLTSLSAAYAANANETSQEAALGRIASALHNNTVGFVAVNFLNTVPATPVPVPTVFT